MKRSIIASFALLLTIGLVGCSGGVNKSHGEVNIPAKADLASFKTGAIYLTHNTANDADIQKAVESLSGHNQFPLVTLNLDNPSDQKKIEAYQQAHSDDIQRYDQIMKMQDKMQNIRINTSEDTNRVTAMVQREYQEAVSLLNDPNAGPQIDKLLSSIAERQELTKDELKQLLDLQKVAKGFTPLITADDKLAANEPILKVVYNGHIRRSFSFGQQPIPTDVRKDAGQLASFLKTTCWLGNFNPSNEAADVTKRLENHESFVLFEYGNTCPHCKKLDPHLQQIEKTLGVTTVRLDLFNAGNAEAFEKLKDQFHITGGAIIPTLVAFKDGKQVSMLTPPDFTTPDPKEDLGYRIEDSKVSQFLSQYGK